MPEIDVADQIILVTGAGRGLGAAYAEAFAARGAQVVVHDAGVAADGTGGDPQVAEGVAAGIRAEGGRAWAVGGDLRDPEVCDALVARTVAQHGRLDVLVHNAGVVLWEDVELPETRIWEETLAVTLTAAYRLARAALPHMRSRGYGRIVLTTSGRATRVENARPGLVAYSAAKLGVVGLMNGLAAGLAEVDVEVNAIAPVAATRVLVRDAPDLTPASVAPAALVLGSSAVHRSGLVLAALGGRFGLEGWHEGELVDLGPAATAEGLADRWGELEDAVR